MGTTHQRGYVTPRGKQWYGYYRKVVNDPATNEPKSVRIPVSLGPKSKMTKTEARQTLEREITKQLGQPGSPTRIMNDGSVNFAWFVTNRFLPLKADFPHIGRRISGLIILARYSTKAL